MKTREQIYGKEATGLLRDITSYHCLHRRQLLRMYPDRERKIENLLQYLVRQGRAFYSEATDCYYDNGEYITDPEMLAAVWVLVDFIDRVEYHTADDMPIKLMFFADGEVALFGKEEQAGKRLVIIESPEQIETLDIQNTAAFCFVDMGSGSVQYFKKE
jgi:hypothetical protein